MSRSRRESSRPPKGAGSDDRLRPFVASLSGGEEIEKILRDNAAMMLRSARRVSLCEDDAQDAVQVASERFLLHRGRIASETLTGWLVTVTRNEALRIRTRRTRTDDLDASERQVVHDGAGPDELVVQEEQLDLAREALAGLKPQERQALLLQAEGHSYDEIAQKLGWTRTKVNRNLTEGRARLRRHADGIIAGEGCAVAGPRINRLAAGAATAEDIVALRPHLRRCSACRARLRQARGGRWAVLPPAVFGWLPWIGRLGGTPPVRTRVGTVVVDRLATLIPGTSNALTEAGLAVTAGVAATALAAGALVGATGEDTVRRDPATRSGIEATAAPASPVGPIPSHYGSPTILETAAASDGLDGSEEAGGGATGRRATELRARKRRAAARRRALRRAAARRSAAERAAQRRRAERAAETAARDAALNAARQPTPNAATSPSTSSDDPTASGAGATSTSSSVTPAVTPKPSNSRGSADDEFGFEP